MTRRRAVSAGQGWLNPVSRRAFLKWAAVLGGAAVAAHPEAPALAAGHARPTAKPGRLAVASALALPVPHRRLPDPDVLLGGAPLAYDLLLVPAYVAAGLVRQGALQPLAGPPGRAHDPDGAFTRPFTYAVSAWLHRGQRAAAVPATPPPEALWPNAARLVVGAALLRLGYSPNDPHAGHLALAHASLLAQPPRLADDLAAAWQAGEAEWAFGLLEANADGLHAPDGSRALLPPEGAMLVEYDWVIPASARTPERSIALIEALQPELPPTLPDLGTRLIPLAPLPERSAEQVRAIWRTVGSRQSAEGG